MRSDGAEIYVLTRPPWRLANHLQSYRKLLKRKGERELLYLKQGQKVASVPLGCKQSYHKNCLFIARIYQSNYSQKNYTYCSENY